MIDTIPHDIPTIYPEIKQKCQDIEFSMLSDIQIGALLKTLVATKPSAHILELGTGFGLALSWMLDGIDGTSKITSIDNDPESISIAREYFYKDSRVELICADGGEWLRDYTGPKFDLIFADAWPGKYQDLDHTLQLLVTGGLYVIDDMIEQPNWPEGHAEKAKNLIAELEEKDHFTMVKMNWSTGIIIMTKTQTS
jgi:predicted O-methyltransferase YrrM